MLLSCSQGIDCHPHQKTELLRYDTIIPFNNRPPWYDIADVNGQKQTIFILEIAGETFLFTCQVKNKMTSKDSSDCYVSFAYHVLAFLFLCILAVQK